MARKLVVEILGDTSGLERSFARASRSTKGFEHDIGRASRGALSAAVSFQGLGRAMAFSSAQFLGGAGIVFALKSTIQAAEENQRVLGQTSVAVTRAGLSWATYGKQIEAAALKQSNLTGFDDERLLGTFSKLVRATGNVTEALNDNALAANIARGANIDLEKAASIVLRASQGQARGLANIGIAARKGATGLELIALLNQKFSGSAVAFGRTAVGAQDRFRVAIENTQEALGKGALPALTLYLNKASDWLNQSKNQERIQRDVAEAVHVLGDAVKVAGTVVKAAADAFEAFSGVVGGSKHALELLVGAFAALKFAPILGGLAKIGAAAGEKGAAGKVGLLSSRLSGLNGITVGAILIPVEIEIEAKISDTIKGVAGGKAASVYDTVIGTIAEGLGIPGFGRGKGITDRILHGITGGSKDAAAKLVGPAKLTVADVAQAISRGLLTAPGVKGLEDRFVTKEQFKAALALAQQDALKFGKAGPASPAPPPFALPPPTPFHKSGRANLSQLALANLALSAAERTKTTTDDLKALNTQHELLAKKIAVETARLAKAPTAKAAKKFATELERLNGLDAAALSEIDALQKKAARKTPTDRAAQRNTFFDNALTRSISQVQDLPIGKQVAALTKIAGDITARIAVTKDVTRKLTLEDDLADVLRQRKATVEGIAGDAAALFDSNISRALDRIGDLPIGKQIAQLKKLAGDITKRIAATQDVQRKRTLEDELTGVRRTIKATAQSIADTAAGLFDSNLSRAIDSVQDIPTIQGQIAKLTAIGATITARIAATKDIAKKKDLEDILLASVTRPLAADRAQLAQDFIDSLSLDVTQADATGNLAKSLATLTALAAGLKKQIAEGVNVAANKAKLSDTLRNIADTKTAVGKKILDALDFGVTKAEATGSLSKQLAANAALQAGLKKQIAASKDATDLQQKLFAAEQHRFDLLKQGREKARQAVTDRLQLASDRADATPGLKDNLATRLAQIELIRKQIQAQGSTNALQEQLLAKENEAKAIRRQIAQAPLDLKAGGLNLARQAADFAITRAGTNLKLLDKATQLAIAVDKKQIAFLKGRIAASKGLARQGFQADLASKQVDLFGLNQSQAAAAKTRLEKNQLAALGLTAEGGLVLPHEAVAKEFKRLKGSLAGTEFDTAANRKVFKRIGDDIKDGWKGVTAVAKQAALDYLDAISKTLDKGSTDQSKFRHVSAAKILAGQGLSPEQIRALTPRIAAIGPGGTVPRPTGQFAGAGGGVTITGPIHLHGVQNLREFEETIEKRARSRAASRRGAR